MSADCKDSSISIPISLFITSLPSLAPISIICIYLFVHKCLDEKYKQNHRVENARKQKKRQHQQECNENHLAAAMPLNQEAKSNEIMVYLEGCLYCYSWHIVYIFGVWNSSCWKLEEPL